jgi:hypothetical protein
MIDNISDSIPIPKIFSSTGLKRLMIRNAIVTEERYLALEKIARNRKFLATYCEEEKINEEAFLTSISETMGVEYLRFHPRNFNVDQIGADLPEAFDEAFALEYRCLPLSKTQSEIVFLLADPLDQDCLSQLEFLFQKKIQLKLAAEGAIVKEI